MRLVRPVVSSGRALVYPVYKSTYERSDALTSPAASPTAFYRDHMLQWSRDLGRTIDYIETRPDLDARRIALYGASWGAKLVPLLAAVEDRVRVGIMVGGGLGPRERRGDIMPEANPINFAPYLRQPMLMVNGRYDFLFPLESSQRSLFDLLGSPAQDKRHVVFDTGHTPPNDLLTKEVLDWLDRYLGPVR
jgi:dienelactone hydrolase